MTSLFKRFFGLSENIPLYFMVGTACSLAIYTPIRHLTKMPDIALDKNARNFGDDIASHPRYLTKALNYKNDVFAKYSKLLKS